MKLQQFKRLLLLLTYMLSFSVSHSICAEQLTKVYKVVNPDGSVSFSDQSQKNAQELLIPPVPTIPAYQAIPVENTAELSAVSADKNASSNYLSMKISAPANNAAFYSGSGDVDVIVELIPALSSGDQLQFQLDGATVGMQTTNQISLKTLDRGSHSLVVNLISKTGETLKTTTSQFTVHRPTVRRP